MKRLGAGLAMLLLAAAPARADFADAARAYDGGDYAAAFAQWRALAEAGNVTAQIAIAGMLRSGAGQVSDAGAPRRWYRRAAEAGNDIAQMNLGEMLTQGEGGPRDPVAGWVWLRRAARQGNLWARDEAARVERRMTREQRTEARRRLGSGR